MKKTLFWAHKPGRARVGILIYADRFKNSLPWKIERYFVKSKKWDIGGGSYTSSLHFIMIQIINSSDVACEKAMSEEC